MAHKSKAADVPPLTLQNQDPRSHRYEVDENAAFSPPSSSHMFQIFDSSEIFSQHPRKYDLLLGDTTSTEKISQVIAHPKLEKKRSKSIAGLEIPSGAEYTNLLEKAHPSITKPEIKNKSLSVGSTPVRRSSVAVMDRPNLGELNVPRSHEPHKLSPLSQKDQDVGQLSKMFRAAFGTGSSWQSHPAGASFPEDEEFSDKPQMGYGAGTSEAQREPSATVFQPRTGEDDLSSYPDLVPVTVQPEPRRLFGFGPSYQPPAETVLVPADQAKTMGAGIAAGGSLLSKVQQAGITAVDAPSRQRKPGILRPPTGEEMNTWAPFST